MKNYGAPWTKVDIDFVVEKTLNGHTTAYIASALGRTERSIMAVKQKADIKARLEARPVETPSKAPSKPAMSGKRWSDADVLQLCQGMARGLSAKTLAQKADRTQAGVCAKLKELGLLEFDKHEMAYYIPRKLFMKVE